MGANKCTLDYYDYATGTYIRNFYAERNPNVIMELGDVGNDIAVYGSRLYVVVNCSHKIEVMDAHTGIRIGQVDIPNCRYIKFKDGNAYISSYVGPVKVDPDSPKGAVYRVDTLSLAITAKVSVGYQPEEMEIIGNKLYVANSGGYRPPDYDNTVSVINLTDFSEERQIPADINLHRLRKDQHGKLWLTSRGDHHSRPSRLLVMEEVEGEMHVTDTLNVPCSNFAIAGDLLYYYASDINEITGNTSVSYGVIDVQTKNQIKDSFIASEIQARIVMPYGIAIHPETGDIFITDARNYVSSGTLYCFNREGAFKWSVRTGDIPSAIAFLSK